MAHPFAHLARDPRFDSLKDVPVLVTGGAGFIGSHLVDALIALRARVVVLDNLATSSLANLEHHLGHSKVATLQELVRDFRRPILTNGAGGSLTLVVGDIRTPEHCALAMGLVTAGTGKTVPKPQIVFHLAALGSVPRSVARPAETVDVNVGGTARVFEAARDAGVQRVVYASSSSVYGDSPHLPKREGEEGQPVSPYALSKSQCERLAQTFGRWWAMEFVGLRYFNVFGPRQSPEGPYAAVVPRFVTAVLAGEPPVIYGDGSQTRDFTFVEDAVLATLLAAVAPGTACGRVFNVAPGVETTVGVLAEKIVGLAGVPLVPRNEPARPGDVPRSVADPTLAEKHLGFRAATPLEVGLARTFAWFRTRAGDSAGSSTREQAVAPW